MPRRGQVSWVALEIPLGASVVVGSLYEDLLRGDRPLAWFGLDSLDPTVDDSGHGYTLTTVGAPTNATTLIPRGDGGVSGCRDFDGVGDAYFTLGTLYSPPTIPPPFHGAVGRAGTTTETTVDAPGDIHAGDLQLACIVHANTAAVITGVPSGWTQIGSTLVSATCAIATFKRLPVADEIPTSYTWTWSFSGQSLGVIGVYRGCDPAVSGLVYDTGQVVTLSDVTHSTTLETHPAQSHAVVFWAAETTEAITPFGTGLKSRADVSAGNVKIVMAEYDLAQAGSVYRTATTTGSVALGAILFTFGSPQQIVTESLDALSENISIHAVIQPDTVAAGVRTIISKENAWTLRLDAATVEFIYRDGGGTDRTITGPTVSAGVTTQLVVTDDGTNIHFYKNGVETTSARLGVAGYTTNANRVTLGAHYSGASYSSFFNGQMDEVAIFAAALSDQMVSSYWTAFQDGTFGDFLQPVDVNRPVYPRGKLEIAWASAPTDDTLIWEDVTHDLRAGEAMSSIRGRNFELDRVETGRMDFTLDNRERQYDDTYTGSPYYPNVKPTRAVRLRAQARTDGGLFDIFFGYSEGHPLLRPHYGLDALAHFTALDPFKALALDKIVGTLVRGSELSGTRLEALLDGFPGIPFAGEVGQSIVIGSDLDGVNSLDHAQQVTETEGGVFFADTRGVVTFQDRHHRAINERTVRATYGDGAGEMRVKNMEPLIDEARLFTAATVTPSTGRVFSALELEQALQHFVRTKEVVTLHASDNDAQAMAEAFALRYATPRTRIPNLVLQPAGHTPDALEMWEAVLGHEISHRIRTIERPLGDTSSVTRDHFVEGISHRISADDWQISVSVSPADLDGDVWLLGSGELGDTSGLTSTVLGW